MTCNSCEEFKGTLEAQGIDCSTSTCFECGASKIVICDEQLGSAFWCAKPGKGDVLEYELDKLADLANAAFTLEIPTCKTRLESFAEVSLVAGKPLSSELMQSMSELQVSEMCANLAHFFNTLHNGGWHDVEFWSEIGHFSRDQMYLSSSLNFLTADPSLIEDASIREHFESELSPFLNNHLNFQMNLVPIHGDMRSWHLIMNEELALHGVIDFGVASYGDAAYDLARAADFLGDEFYAAASEAYLGFDTLYPRAMFLEQVFKLLRRFNIHL